MSQTRDFTWNVKGYTTKHPILIDETAVAAQRDLECNAIPGPQKVLVAGNWVKEFTVGPFQLSTRTLTIHAAHAPGGVGCYFLPYRPDCATTMTLGNAALWFFTSNLTGCTVQVIGPAATPTVTHANARTRYNQEVENHWPKRADGRNENPDLVDDTTKNHVEATAGAIAQMDMNGLLPAVPGGVTSGVLPRAGYQSKVNQANVEFGKRYFNGHKLNYSLSNDVVPSRTLELNKPEVGAFVFGYFKHGGWKFYCQASVKIRGNFDVWHFLKPNEKRGVYGNSIVLGAPTKIFG